jgi:N,N-dimethylformamidase
MTLFDTRGGGSVFSVGSITWTASLSHNRYDNNVAGITRNVLRHFMR